MPPLILALERSLTVNTTSTRSGEPGTGLASYSADSTKGCCSMRCLERSSATLDSKAPSSWRTSRRRVSSLLRVVPLKLISRT
jgi:hypothetical protein